MSCTGLDSDLYEDRHAKQKANINTINGMATIVIKAGVIPSSFELIVEAYMCQIVINILTKLDPKQIVVQNFMLRRTYISDSHKYGNKTG